MKNKENNEVLLFIVQDYKQDEEIELYKNDSSKTVIVTDYKNKTKTRTDIIKCKPVSLEMLNRYKDDGVGN